MTPAEFKDARKTLGLTQEQFAERLGFGQHGRRQVQRIEKGANVTGPMALAVQFLLSERARQPHPQEGGE